MDQISLGASGTVSGIGISRRTLRRDFVRRLSSCLPIHLAEGVEGLLCFDAFFTSWGKAQLFLIHVHLSPNLMSNDRQTHNLINYLVFAGENQSVDHRE